MKNILALTIFFLLFFCMVSSAEEIKTIRCATFNASMYRDLKGRLLEDLKNGNDKQIENVAEIIQRVNPDILLINEFDYYENNVAIDAFKRNYLEVSHNGSKAIHFNYIYHAQSNTGVDTGYDLNKNGILHEADDCFGFGQFEGQYAFALFSKYPIDHNNMRTFRKFLWKDMPNALIPYDYYTKEEVNILRLSSKNHVDVPIRIDEGIVFHILASHPTPPTFDGPEDRNGKRNYDEIRFFADYIDPNNNHYIYDDNGKKGGLTKDVFFIIMGDLNADPFDGDSIKGAVNQLLDKPMINQCVSYGSCTPSSLGGIEYSKSEYGSTAHKGNPAYDTASFAGGLRVDYVLPSANLTTIASGIFWPTQDDPLYRLVEYTDNGPASSDHHLVWIDIVMP
ncbi:MAG: endonuclease/exonuclease/phosphatase family protein [Deferribacterota bacterium]|nr:endonuclease/exonuclease/phosphatase family protein [Deferribacterota bacterium]